MVYGYIRVSTDKQTVENQRVPSCGEAGVGRTFVENAEGRYYYLCRTLSFGKESFDDYEYSASVHAFGCTGLDYQR